MRHRIDDAFQFGQACQFRGCQPTVSIHDKEVTGQGKQGAALALPAHLASHLLDLRIGGIDRAVEFIVLGRGMNLDDWNPADILALGGINHDEIDRGRIGG